jgi:CRISPR-associated endonuclease/helicase Cas3
MSDRNPAITCLAEVAKMPEAHYAHTLEGASRERWQPLSEHLDEVARRAAAHAAAFGSAAWGELAGRWHDLGKYAEDFQSYLESFAPRPEVVDASVLDGRPDGKPGRVDHSSAGAVHVLERCAGRLVGVDRDELPAAEAALAMVIAGHHSGLPERMGFESDRLTKPEKRARLVEVRRGGAPEELLGLALPSLPALLRPESFTCRGSAEEKKVEKLLRYEFWTRMLFSALIDADRLDTERFMSKEKFGSSVFKCKTGRKGASVLEPSGGSARSTNRSPPTPDSDPGSGASTGCRRTSARTSAW